MITTAPKIKKSAQQSGSLHLTKKVDYGLFLLSTLALKKGQTSIKEIAKENRLSFPFLQKIASQLQKERLITSQRGKYGGYKLTKPASKMTLKEILEALEGPIALAPCFHKHNKFCKHSDFCKIKNGLEKINDEIKQAFLKKTLRQLVLPEAKKPKQAIYLDNAATTQLDPRIIKTLNKYHLEDYGNSSSLHFMGDKSFQALENSRKKIAKILHCKTENLTFTSGATEANNLVIKGVMRANKDKGRHLIVSEIEHSSVIVPAQQLEKEGFEVSYLPVNKEGFIEPQKLEKALRKDTILVSVMTVNNEVGTIQEIKKLCEITHKNGSYFHTDAVQAVPYEKINIDRDKIDFLTLSAHKFHGPKGVGLAYLNPKIKIQAQQNGGGQEKNTRSGTSNIPGIVGMAETLELAYKERDKQIKKTRELKKLLLEEIKKEIPGTKINGSLEKSTPHILNIQFNQIEGEAILMDLSIQGICVSTGSACSSKSLKVSHVLNAMGVKKEDLNSSIRFSFGKFNNNSDIKKAISALKKTVARLRSFSALK